MPTDHPPNDPKQLATQLINQAKAQGFALAGVCRAEPTDFPDEFRDWLAEGQHGDMAWLANHIEQRLDPTRFAPGCRSLLLVADLYQSRNDPPPDQHTHQSTIPARIARYAQGDDYHIIIKQRLHQLADQLRAAHPDHAFRAFTDTAPILEREHSARAGLGWIGKHTLLIHPTLGSYLLLGGIATTLELQPPDDQQPITDHCGTCTRCIDACPTDAITERSVNAARCISYLTIEHRAPIDPQYHEPIGDWLFGCDICQQVCPHNSPRPNIPTGSIHPAYAPRHTHFDALNILNWTAEDRTAALSRTAIKRAKLDMLQRNALIVAANALLDEQTPTAACQNIRAKVQSLANPSPDSTLPSNDLLHQTARDLLAHHPAFHQPTPHPQAPPHNESPQAPDTLP